MLTHRTVFILSLFFILLLPFFAAAQDEEYEKLIEVTDDLYYVPDQSIVKGLKISKELHADVDGKDFIVPETMAVHGDHLYIFDVEIEKLLKFDLDGNFLGSPFPEDLKIVNHIRYMCFDEAGRVLLTDGRDFYIFDGEELEHFQNEYSLYSVVWDGEYVYGINAQAAERKEGIIVQLDLAEGTRETWGEVEGHEDNEYSMFAGKWTSGTNGTYYFTLGSTNKIYVLDLKNKTVSIATLGVPAFEIRAARNAAIYKMVQEGKRRSFRTFPVFRGNASAGERLFLYEGHSRFFRILELDENQNLVAVYQMLPMEKEYPWDIAAALVDGQLRFFVVTAETGQDERDFNAYILEITEEGPTEEDALQLAEQRKKEYEQSGEKEKMERQQKMWAEYNKLFEKTRDMEDPDKRAELHLAFYEKHKGETIAINALASLIGRDISKKLALKIKPLILKELENLEDQRYQGFISSALSRLASSLEDAALLKKAWSVRNPESLHYFEVIQFAHTAIELEAWDLLDVILADTEQFIEENDVAHLVGSGTTENLSLDGKRFLYMFHFYKGVAAFHDEEYQQALEQFDKAREYEIMESLSGYGEKFTLYEAKALSAIGKHEKALETLIPETILFDRPDNMAVLEEIHARTDSEKSFAEFIEAEKEKRLVKLADVSFYDYDKKPVNVNEKLGKLTILTFWTPST